MTQDEAYENLKLAKQELELAKEAEAAARNVFEDARSRRYSAETALGNARSNFDAVFGSR